MSSIQIPDSPRLLIVDDEEFVLEVVRETLQGTYHITATQSPEEALRILEQVPHEILITDLMMSEMHGMDLMRSARQIQPQLIGIVMTGFASKEAAVAALKEGAYDLLEKPFSPDALEQAVERAWQSLRTSLENQQLIEELREAHKALVESEGRLRQLASNIQEVFWMSNAALTEIAYVSPAYEDVWGRSCASLLEQPRSLIDAVHEEDRVRVENALNATHPGWTGFDEEFRVVWPDESIRWIWGRAFPVRDEKNVVYRIAGVALDITKRREDEMQRKQFTARIQHAQKLESLGVLAGGTAHDFNNLLGGILGNADLALLDIPEESPARHSVEQIQKTAMRAAEITKQLLAYSGKGKFVVTPIDLSVLVKEMGELLDLSISKMALLRYNFAKSLPAIIGDATQLRQVIMNLIFNASDALGEMGGVITVRTGTVMLDREYLQQVFLHELAEGEYVYVELSDTGCGMDAETQASIFDPFFTTKFAGRGLGAGRRSGHRALTRRRDRGLQPTRQGRDLPRALSTLIGAASRRVGPGRKSGRRPAVAWAWHGAGRR